MAAFSFLPPRLIVDRGTKQFFGKLALEVDGFDVSRRWDGAGPTADALVVTIELVTVWWTDPDLEKATWVDSGHLEFLDLTMLLGVVGFANLNMKAGVDVWNG